MRRFIRIIRPRRFIRRDTLPRPAGAMHMRGMREGMVPRRGTLRRRGEPLWDRRQGIAGMNLCPRSSRGTWASSKGTEATPR